MFPERDGDEVVNVEAPKENDDDENDGFDSIEEGDAENEPNVND